MKFHFSLKKAHLNYSQVENAHEAAPLYSIKFLKLRWKWFYFQGGNPQNVYVCNSNCSFANAWLIYKAAISNTQACDLGVWKWGGIFISPIIIQINSMLVLKIRKQIKPAEFWNVPCFFFLFLLLFLFLFLICVYCFLWFFYLANIVLTSTHQSARFLELKVRNLLLWLKKALTMKNSEIIFCENSVTHL